MKLKLVFVAAALALSIQAQAAVQVYDTLDDALKGAYAEMDAAGIRPVLMCDGPGEGIVGAIGGRDAAGQIAVFEILHDQSGRHYVARVHSRPHWLTEDEIVRCAVSDEELGEQRARRG